MYSESIRIEIEAARKDAARYRAIRDRDENADPKQVPWAAIMTHKYAVVPISGGTLDAMVDAYIAWKSCAH